MCMCEKQLVLGFEGGWEIVSFVDEGLMVLTLFESGENVCECVCKTVGSKLLLHATVRVTSSTFNLTNWM